ncbi:hypothetical protein CHS0354_009305 [Potamilus streckersoni]|uniref:Uncharacterized protein n=1 Tax=Potamilus streckersoni TaxID=2493646 RepID=A0AAE0SN00_9BIVA|nr:hypothetical protein CHS0354_009305 [Potamilus streckersoni]
MENFDIDHAQKDSVILFILNVIKELMVQRSFCQAIPKRLKHILVHNRIRLARSKQNNIRGRKTMCSWVSKNQTSTLKREQKGERKGKVMQRMDIMCKGSNNRRKKNYKAIRQRHGRKKRNYGKTNITLEIQRTTYVGEKKDEAVEEGKSHGKKKKTSPKEKIKQSETKRKRSDSVNDGIPTQQSAVHYEGIDDAITCIKHLGGEEQSEAVIEETTEEAKTETAEETVEEDEYDPNEQWL